MVNSYDNEDGIMRRLSNKRDFLQSEVVGAKVTVVCLSLNNTINLYTYIFIYVFITQCLSSSFLEACNVIRSKLDARMKFSSR